MEQYHSANKPQNRSDFSRNPSFPRWVASIWKKKKEKKERSELRCDLRPADKKYVQPRDTDNQLNVI